MRRAARPSALARLLLFLLGLSALVQRKVSAASRPSHQKYGKSKAASVPRRVAFLPNPGNVLHRANVPPSPPARKRRLFIHIGPHKTGTSYFQTWISVLGGISGDLVYPLPCGHVTRHVWYAQYADWACNIGKWAPTTRPCEPTTESLIGSIERLPEGQDAIISSEAFSHCNRLGFSSIYLALSPIFDIYVIGVHRNSRSLFLSRFHEVHKDFEKPDRLWDAVTQGDWHADLCSYMSVACIERLAEVFGRDRVVTVSYEGMKAAGKELAGVICEEFSASACFEPTGLMGLEKNTSPQHVTYSALGLYNRLRLLLACEDNYLFSALTPIGMKRKAGYNVDEAGLADPHKSLEIWLQALKDVGVRQNCLPMQVLHTSARGIHESDSEFHRLVQRGDLPGRHLYYEENEASTAMSELCEYDEAAVWENQETLDQLCGVVRDISSCSSVRTLQMDELR